MKMDMKIKDILRDDFTVKGNVDKDISGVSYDSRNVQKNHLFVAVKGEKFDGHDFIKDAIHKGATAIVYEE